MHVLGRWRRAGALNPETAAIERAPAGGANPYFCGVIRKPNIKHLTRAVREREAELETAGRQGRSALNRAIKRLLDAKAELRRAEAERSMASCARAAADAF